MCQTCDVTARHLLYLRARAVALSVDRLKALMYKGQGHVQGWMYINTPSWIDVGSTTSQTQFCSHGPK